MTLRIYFGIVSLAILVLSLTNYWVEYIPTWKGWQRDHYDLLAKTIMDKDRDADKAARARNTPLEFKQIYNQELGVVDRCVICHLGMDSPLMEDAPNPHKAHPGNLLASHPFGQIGCTICHHGQGLATTLDDAHGRVPHWERPLLRGDFVQATCTKCHQEDEVPDAPVLTRGKRLLRELGCVGCHQTGEIVAEEKVGPRLSAIGSKVSRKWLNKWLINPEGYLPAGKMPHYHLNPQAANALAAYLMTFKSKAIDEMPEQQGDYEAGDAIRREAQCVVCHKTQERGDVLVGGTLGPSLLKLGNKVNQRWLVAFLRDPHAFYPNTKMPTYNLSGSEDLNKKALDLSQFAMEEWLDYELLDAEEQEPNAPADTEELIEQGRLLYGELGCAGCHDLTGEPTQPPGPDLTFIGSKPVHDLDFGDAEVPHTLPDFLYTKLTSPKELSSEYRLPLGEDPAAAIWKNLQPKAMFSDSVQLPELSDERTASDRLAWILGRIQEQFAQPPKNQQQDARSLPDGERQDVKKQNILTSDLKLPEGSPQNQAVWLAGILNEAGVLNPLKMPDFLLSDADAEALCIALMSLSAERISSRRYVVPRKREVFFNPQDEFGQLERRYRCLSCHGIRSSGDNLASDLTFEGSRVNREWLYHYLKTPYSMRRTITIAMPIFNFPDEEARFMAEYMSQVFVDSQIGVGWKKGRSAADADRGKALFDAKGCIACHQVQGIGGDVGPSLTTQVPDFPQGTWVGDKLRGGWIYQWLKDPHSLVPGALEPNLGLSDSEAADLTAYLLSLKNPEYQSEN